MSALQLYAVLRAGAALELPARGVAGEPLRAVRDGGLELVCGALEGREPPRADAGALARHDALVRALFEHAEALLPARFGQVAADEGALREAVERARGRLEEALALVAGCAQVTLRLVGELDEEPAPPPTPQPALAGAGPGARYLAARQREHALASTPPALLEPLLASLAPLVRAQRVERRRLGPVAASVYQLVPRADLAEHRAALERALALPDAPPVRAGGPFPPYAFAPGWSA